jgi:hypothetical protein
MGPQMSVSMKKPAIGSLDIPTREMSVAAMAALMATAINKLKLLS